MNIYGLFLFSYSYFLSGVGVGCCSLKFDSKNNQSYFVPITTYLAWSAWVVNIYCIYMCISAAVVVLRWIPSAIFSTAVILQTFC